MSTAPFSPNQVVPPSTSKRPRPSAQSKAAAEEQRAKEALERANKARQEAERKLDLLVGHILRSAARADPMFREAMKAKLRAAKLTRREAAEIQHLIDN